MDGGVNLPNECPRERDTDLNTLVVAHGVEGMMNNATQVKRHAVGGFGWAQVTPNFLEALPEVLKMDFERLGDQDLIEASLQPGHGAILFEGKVREEAWRPCGLICG
jgi:hypothetical protein